MSGTVQPVAWTESAEELYATYRAERDGGRRKRVQALWLLRRGRPLGEVARDVGVGRRTVTRWLGWYRGHGLAHVLARVPGHGARGQPSRLSPAQQEALVARSATGAFRTYDEARQWVAQEYGVAYSYQGVYSLLARHGGHPKVPRPQATKADPAAQAAWQKGGSPRP